MYLPELGEQVAAEQGARRGVVQESAFPSVRQVRRIDPLHRMLPEREVLLIGKHPRRTVGQIPDGHHCGDLPAEGHGPRRGRKELIERSAFVGLDVRERDIPKRRHRDDAPDGVAHGFEQHARTGVEQQWLGIADQILIEGKATRDDARRDGSADPEDVLRDLVDAGGRGLAVGSHDFAFLDRGRVRRGRRSARQSPAMRAASGLERPRASSCQAG